MSSVFQQSFDQRHEYALRWKERTGGKVIGYFCTYVPEELLLAADILPVRILPGDKAVGNTERHIPAMFCPFCRGCLSQGLKGKYDYADGVMIAQSCLHIRQAYNSWTLHVPHSFHYYLNMPQGVQRPREATDYLVGELKVMKSALEEFTGRPITESDLQRGIETMNRNRRLLKQMYEARRHDYPWVDGVTAMYAVLASQVVDKNEHSAEMEKLLAGLKEPDRSGEKPIRLMMIGSENDDTELVRMAESLTTPTAIVVDDHCSGSRYFWNEVEPDADPLRAIAKRYVERVPCPSKDWPQRTRVEHIKQLVKDYGVQGAIILQQKFCDPFETDIPPLRKALDDLNIPSYVFELDVTTPLGPFRIRLEAMLEMLNEELIF